MGQKINPTGFRMAVTEPWRSRWFARKGEFADLLKQDHRIREFVKKEYGYAGISKVEIERGGKRITVILHCARAGLLIGRQGVKVDQLQRALEGIVREPVELKIREIKRPELEAQLVAESIGEQLIKRAAFRRTIKKAVETTMSAGAQGIKVMISGRLGGADMARTEVQRQGRIPLQSLRARVSYGLHEARTTYGIIGIKVWIYMGMISDEEKDDIGRGLIKPKRQDRRRFPAGNV